MDGDCVGTGETRGNQSRGKRDEGLRRCFGGRRRQAKDAGKKPCCFFFLFFFGSFRGKRVEQESQPSGGNENGKRDMDTAEAEAEAVQDAKGRDNKRERL